MFADFRIPPGNLDLPGTERELATLIGRSATMRLSWRVWQMNPFRGGGHKRGFLYVPQRRTDRFLALVESSDIADVLIRRYDGELVELQGCQGAWKRLRLHAIRKLIAHGARQFDVAKAAGISERQVRRACHGVTPADAWPADKIATHLVELDSIRWLLCQDPLKR